MFIFLIGCLLWPVQSHAGDQAVFKRINPDSYPEFKDDLNFDGLVKCIYSSIDYLKKLSPSTMITFGKDSYSVGYISRSLKTFMSFIKNHPSIDRLQAYIRQNFYVYAFVERGRPADVLFTGYYAPMLNGSRVETDKYKYPVYQRPKDLVTINLSDFSTKCSGETVIGRNTGKTVVPYYTRRQIMETDCLKGKATPIAWVSDPVDLFFLHIQGSGKIRLEDGESINVHYLISNGYPYRSIGKYLIEKKKLTKGEISMQSIRAYLKAHPDEMQEIFNYNPRYVFFEQVDKGPTGCFNIELTPGRSIALDQKQYPPMALVFITTRKPIVNEDGVIQKWADFSRFMVNQDTGSAILGPNRADIFWGYGAYAELAAGHLKHPGKMYFLVLRPDRNSN